MFAAFLTTLLFSISVICGHQSTKVMGGTEANFWRLTVATILLGAYAHLLGQGLGGGSFHIFIISGLIGVGVADMALFQALPRLGSRLTLLILQCLSTPIAALMEWAWLGTKLNNQQLICIAVVLAGVVMGLMPDKNSPPRLGNWRAGLIICVISAIGNAAGAVISRSGFRLAAETGQQIDGATAAYQRLVGGVVIAGICLLVVKRRSMQFNFHSNQSATPGATRTKWRRALPWVVANGVAGQTLGVSCYQWAFKTTPAGVVLSIVALTPLVAVPLTRYIEGEIPSLRSLVGTVISVGGAVGLVWVTM